MNKKTVLRSTVLAIAAVGLVHCSTTSTSSSASSPTSTSPPPTAAQSANEATAWAAIKMPASAAQLKAFLDKYPNGTYAPQARQKYSVVTNMMLAPEVQHIAVQFPEDIRDMGRDIGPLRVVKLNILVQQDGKASDVNVAETSGFDPYDQAAIEAAKDASYFPAMNHGMPVQAQMAYNVSFGFLCNRAAGDVTCDDGRYPTTCSATVCSLLLR